ncbi:hypothetical protein GQ53DRAFT_790114 [Thozetella sp. PMI_491]|nr:hypothetical protein GQ53DRAFT_790114 [Thozetella sp. PMI_491]
MFSKAQLFYTAGIAAAASVTNLVPSTVPTHAAVLDSTPIGVSFEFFMWPSYMTNISLVHPCLEHISRLYKKILPIRIGGTTQDRATYDPTFSGYVSYTTPDPLTAPTSLTYGRKFFDLIPRFGAETLLGFNRGDNNRSNTFEAVLAAKARPNVMGNLWAIELGNEPDLYLSYWHKPVAIPPWNESQEGADAADWAQDFANRWVSPLPILSGGAYAVPLQTPDWPNLRYLITQAYNASVKAATKVYCGHLYALSNSTELSSEMNHNRTVADLSYFTDYVSLAASLGREYIIGETGFHGQDVEHDASFGGAIQILDKSLRAVSMGIKRLYFHQGTINQAYFNWWSSNQVEYPYYGGFMAALALQGAEHVIATDNGADSYAQYVIFRNGTPCKIVLINTDYYSGNGTRLNTSFTLTGLRNVNTVSAIRMTASSSEITASSAKLAPSSGLSIGGQTFSDTSCKVKGEPVVENIKVKGGTATLTLAASEALIVYL